MVPGIPAESKSIVLTLIEESRKELKIVDRAIEDVLVELDRLSDRIQALEEKKRSLLDKIQMGQSILSADYKSSCRECGKVLLVSKGVMIHAVPSEELACVASRVVNRV